MQDVETRQKQARPSYFDIYYPDRQSAPAPADPNSSKHQENNSAAPAVDYRISTSSLSLRNSTTANASPAPTRASRPPSSTRWSLALSSIAADEALRQNSISVTRRSSAASETMETYAPRRRPSSTPAAPSSATIASVSHSGRGGVTPANPRTRPRPLMFAPTDGEGDLPSPSRAQFAPSPTRMTFPSLRRMSSSSSAAQVLPSRSNSGDFDDDDQAMNALVESYERRSTESRPSSIHSRQSTTAQRIRPVSMVFPSAPPRADSSQDLRQRRSQGSFGSNVSLSENQPHTPIPQPSFAPAAQSDATPSERQSLTKRQGRLFFGNGANGRASGMGNHKWDTSDASIDSFAKRPAQPTSDQPSASNSRRDENDTKSPSRNGEINATSRPASAVSVDSILRSYGRASPPSRLELPKPSSIATNSPSPTFLQPRPAPQPPTAPTAGPQSTPPTPNPARSAVKLPVVDTVKSPDRIRTIDEIIRQHAGTQYVAKLDEQRRAPSSDTSDEPRASVDSISTDLATHLALEEALEREAASPTRHGLRKISLRRDDRLARSTSASSNLGQSGRLTPSVSQGRLSPEQALSPARDVAERELAALIRSPRLTRLVRLQRSPNQGLTVSLADVGDPAGHPVIVFLGLGCVRYLVALYDDIALALGLRLICLDRWGLGRTSEVPDKQRGFDEWATIVQEAADQLELRTFSLLAHSAGAPYALAVALAMPDRVVGAIHLLAPWLSVSGESLAGAYKYLRYVPTSVIKTAQAAEWKMQAWRLGKPPTPVSHSAVGYDHRADKLSIAPSLSPSHTNGARIPRSGSHLELKQTSTATSLEEREMGRTTPDGSVFGAGPRQRSSFYAADAFVTPPRPSSSMRGHLTPTSSARPAALARRASSDSQASALESPTSALSPRSSSSGDGLANALLRASHAESLRGSTSDLLVILERTAKPESSYTRLTQGVKVWQGDKDDRISLSSVKALETTLKDCRVKVVAGADHSLMTSESLLGVSLLKACS